MNVNLEQKIIGKRIGEGATGIKRARSLYTLNFWISTCTTFVFMLAINEYCFLGVADAMPASANDQQKSKPTTLLITKNMTAEETAKRIQDVYGIKVVLMGKEHWQGWSPEKTVNLKAYPSNLTTALRALNWHNVASVKAKDKLVIYILPSGVDISKVVNSIDALVKFIVTVGSEDIHCEQTYFALSRLNFGNMPWWQKLRDVQKLVNVAKNPDESVCVRMVALELYIAKLTKVELEKVSDDLQSYFKGSSNPDNLVARLTQLLAEKGVAPTQLIETILESDYRGQAARSHAWYSADLTKTYSANLLNLAMEDASSERRISGKMALEYMSKLPPSNPGTKAEEDKITPLIRQLCKSVLELPNNVNFNEMAHMLAVVSAVPRFLPEKEVVSFLGDIVTKAANNNAKLAALDILLSIRDTHEVEVNTQIRSISDDIETIFPDKVDRMRAMARVSALHETEKNR